MSDTEKPDFEEMLVELIQNASRHELSAFADGFTKCVIETRKDDPNAYPGIKVPIKPKALSATNRSFVTILQDWAGA